MLTAYATFDPYQQWLGIPPHEQPPNQYRLLGLPPFEQDLYAISAAADRLLAYLGNVTDPTYAPAAGRLYEEIVNARLNLTDPYRKAQYDGWLSQSLGAAPAMQQPMGMPGMQGGYQQPMQQYAAPQPQYTAPQQYAPQQYSAPQPQYTAPHQQYAAPQPQYTAPQQQYTAPQPQPQVQAPAQAPAVMQEPANTEPTSTFVSAQPLMPPSRSNPSKSTIVRNPVPGSTADSSPAPTPSNPSKSAILRNAVPGAPAESAPAPTPSNPSKSAILRNPVPGAPATPSNPSKSAILRNPVPGNAVQAPTQPAPNEPTAGFVPSSGYAPGAGSYSTGNFYSTGSYAGPAMQQPAMQQPVMQQPVMQPAPNPIAGYGQYAPQPMVPADPVAHQPTPGSPAPEMAAPGWQVGGRAASSTETVEKQQPPWKLFGAIAAGLVGIIIIGVIRNMDTPRRPQGTVANNTPVTNTPTNVKDPVRVAPPPPVITDEPKSDTPVEPVIPVEEPKSDPKKVQPLPVEEPTVEPKSEPKKTERPKTEAKKMTEPKQTPDPAPMEPDEPGTLPSEIKTVVKPVTVDPATDPTIDLAQAKKAAELLNKARAAMARRDISLARQRLAGLKNQAKTKGQEQELARLEMLCDQLDDFWSAIRKTMDSIKNMDDIEINETRVGIVEIAGDKMILRVRGVNKTYHVDTMSQTLTMFLANRWYKPIPSSKIFKGAFYAMDAQGDRKIARELWEQAKREGGSNEREVADILLPELDVMLVTDAPDAND